MSRFNVILVGADRTDPAAVIGYDRPLRTFFLQGFEVETDDFEEPEVWLGTALEEFPTLENLVEEVRRRGFEIRALEQAAIITMLSEAGQKPEASLGERLGIVF
ncbi:hypothetical protein H7Q97_20155 [Ochrobactrum sp. CM-21-5]|nr:hypothetical protein [Ochrobactrum sp. CM-21-5]MBC2887694.1 hypothetical protein [Ochrobactrum sp. CM-21-5]